MHSPTLEREFLSSDDQVTEKVRCPVHGFIRYSKNERSIIEHWSFQRLRHIRQLATEYLVYPGAMHTRFEHSLGVMELATRALNILWMRDGPKIKAELQQIPELAEHTFAKTRQLLRLHALLHDTGHPAFSHTGEVAIPGGKHEPVSEYVAGTVLGVELDSRFFAGAADLLQRLMKGSPELGFLRQFVVGEMDMDRTDYLRRDSLHCGVDYGVFDSLRLLESLTVVEHPNSGLLQLALRRGGEHTFEALILARYQMNTQVYYHRIRRIYDHYVKEYLKLWAAEHCRTIDNVLENDDVTLLNAIRTDVKENGPKGVFARRIVQRRHHRMVYESGDNADRVVLQSAKKILKELTKKYDTVDFILDDAPVKIHKLSVRGDQDEAIEDFYVVGKNGRPTQIGYESPIIQKIPKAFRTVRIFADADPSLAATIEADVQQLERSIS